MRASTSPCVNCSRVPDPDSCMDKNCLLWQRWFIARWDALRHRGWVVTDRTDPVGVPLGGRHYAAPHEVEAYFRNDPCESCLCPRELCDTPCRMKRGWEENRKEVGV